MTSPTPDQDSTLPQLKYQPVQADSEDPHWIRVVLAILAAYPVGMMLLMMAAYYLTWIKLGYQPVVVRDSPAGLAVYLTPAIVVMILGFVPAVFLHLACTIGYIAAFSPSKWNAGVAILMLLTWVAAPVVLYVAPGSPFDWVLD